MEVHTNNALLQRPLTAALLLATFVQFPLYLKTVTMSSGSALRIAMRWEPYFRLRRRLQVCRTWRRTSGPRNFAAATATHRHQDSTADPFHVAEVVLAGGLVGVVALALHNEKSQGPTASCDPLHSKTLKQTMQPRNVMLHRMRSLKGRGLNDKYNVDWKTVMGEGAYGSVHPARVALTGEKVSIKHFSPCSRSCSMMWIGCTFPHVFHNLVIRSP